MQLKTKRSIKKALMLALTTFVGLACSTVHAGEFSPELPPGTQIKQEKIFWGEEVNGLQLGISLLPKLEQRVEVSVVDGQKSEVSSHFLSRSYHIGQVATFSLSVRNVSQYPIKITHSQPLLISPDVVDEKGKQLSLQQQVLLWGPAYNGAFFSPITTSIVAPEEILQVAYAQLTLGPPANIDILNNPTLDVPPGKYQVRYSYDFPQDSKEDKTSTVKSWIGSLSSKIILEVAPPKEQ